MMMFPKLGDLRLFPKRSVQSRKESSLNTTRPPKIVLLHEHLNSNTRADCATCPPLTILHTHANWLRKYFCIRVRRRYPVVTHRST